MATTTICLHCGRRFGEVDDGFWVRLGQCPCCGRFTWEERPWTAPDEGLHGLRLALFYIAFAVDLRARWRRGPWLTRDDSAICGRQGVHGASDCIWGDG